MESALARHTEGRDLPAGREKARELAAASVSANTRRAYEGAIRRLRDWLAGRPLDDATLAEYLASRFEAGHSSATERVLAGFRREGQSRGRGQVAAIRDLDVAHGRHVRIGQSQHEEVGRVHEPGTVLFRDLIVEQELNVVVCGHGDLDGDGVRGGNGHDQRVRHHHGTHLRLYRRRFAAAGL